MVSTHTTSLAQYGRHWRVRAPDITQADVDRLRAVAGCGVHRTADGVMLVFWRGAVPGRWAWHVVCAALRREVDVCKSDHMELLRDAEIGMPSGVLVLS